MAAYHELIERFKAARLLDSVGAVVGWDQHTYMPPAGAGHRAEQMGFLAKLGHHMLTDPKVGEVLAIVESSPLVRDADSDEAVNVREIRRSYDRAVKMPPALVEEIARVTSQAQNIWAEARRKSDFATFAPWLGKIVALKRQEAKAVGFKES